MTERHFWLTDVTSHYRNLYNRDAKL